MEQPGTKEGTLERGLAIALIALGAGAALVAKPPKGDSLGWWAFGSPWIYRAAAFTLTIGVGLAIGTVLLRLWRGDLPETFGKDGLGWKKTAKATIEIEALLADLDARTEVALSEITEAIAGLDTRLLDVEDLTNSE